MPKGQEISGSEYTGRECIDDVTAIVRPGGDNRVSIHFPLRAEYDFDHWRRSVKIAAWTSTSALMNEPVTSNDHDTTRGVNP